MWILNRVVAAIVGTIVVGVVTNVIVALVNILTCGPTCTSMEFFANGSLRCQAYSSDCGSLVGVLLFGWIAYTTSAVILGTVPGVVALTLTPAKKHPWRSLPLLVLATLTGFGIWLFVGTYVAPLFGSTLRQPNPILALAATFAFPTIAGLLVAFNIDRVPYPIGLRRRTE